MTDHQEGYAPISRYEDADRDLQLEVLGQESSARWGRKRGDITSDLMHSAYMAKHWDDGFRG